MSDRGSTAGGEARATAETERIRAVFGDRDRRRQPPSGVAEAYRLINADRLERMRQLVEALYPGVKPSLLDVGCGGGYDLTGWRAAGWPEDRLAGAELVEARVAQARAANPGVEIRQTHGPDLPWEDETFDVATAVTVFSSILDAASRRRLFAEMWRVVRLGGYVIVYDFVVRNPRNRHVIALPTSRLRELGGPPDGTTRMTPLVHLVAAGAGIHPALADVAMRLAPRTHQLTYWRRLDRSRGERSTAT